MVDILVARAEESGNTVSEETEEGTEVHDVEDVEQERGEAVDAGMQHVEARA